MNGFMIIPEWTELKEMHDEQTKLLKKTLKSVIHLYDVDSKKRN